MAAQGRATAFADVCDRGGSSRPLRRRTYPVAQSRGSGRRYATDCFRRQALGGARSRWRHLDSCARRPWSVQAGRSGVDADRLCVGRSRILHAVAPGSLSAISSRRAADRRRRAPSSGIARDHTLWSMPQAAPALPRLRLGEPTDTFDFRSGPSTRTRTVRAWSAGGCLWRPRVPACRVRGTQRGEEQ